MCSGVSGTVAFKGDGSLALVSVEVPDDAADKDDDDDDDGDDDDDDDVEEEEEEEVPRDVRR